VRYIEITSSHDGQRVDNFLFTQLKGVPKSMVYRVLRRGEVRLNGKRIQPSQRLQAGDNLRIPPVRIGEQRERSSQPLPAFITNLQNAIIYEDHNIIVIDKPAGFAVHGGSGIDFGVIEVLRIIRPEEQFLELAHRLDRGTSGCLILAKTIDALRLIQDALKARQVEKRYFALVRGYWDCGSRDIDMPLQRNVPCGGERLVKVTAAGRPALTKLRPVSSFREASLIEAIIATGRTHQIRVHAAHIGYPLAGDKKYGDPIFNSIMCTQYGLNRLFLHAYSLMIPLCDRKIVVSAPLSTELEAVLYSLGLKATNFKESLKSK
jgi:23S rRNA pseudouridine955/2504/2580 synthase